MVMARRGRDWAIRSLLAFVFGRLGGVVVGRHDPRIGGTCPAAAPGRGDVRGDCPCCVGCSRNTVSHLLGFACLDPLEPAEFLAGRMGVNQAERFIGAAPWLPGGLGSRERVPVCGRENLATGVARLFAKGRNRRGGDWEDG